LLFKTVASTRTSIAKSAKLFNKKTLELTTAMIAAFVWKVLTIIAHGLLSASVKAIYVPFKLF
jgi:hypothetical protein